MRLFYAFQLQQQGNTLFRSGRLLQQFIVDIYASIEEDRLDYIKPNQNNLRSETYIIRGDTNAQVIGKRFILPSSYTRSPRYMIQSYQYAMSICRHHENLDIFVTFTCNLNIQKLKEFYQ